MVAALALLAVMVRERQGASAIGRFFVPSPQQLVNIKVPRKVPLEELSDVQTTIRAVEARLAGQGRVLVRYSGTEMKARVMVEGPDADEIAAHAQAIAEVLLAALAQP
jgi:phosphoglucosamine mutase